MAVVNTGSYSVDLTGVHTVRIKQSLWAYVPRVVSIVTLLLSIYVAVLFGGMVIGSFPSNASIWERIGGTLFFIFIAGVSLVIAYASIRVISSDGGDDDDHGVLKWALGLSIVFCLLAAVMNYGSVTDLQNSGATISQPWTRDMVSSAQNSAGLHVISAFILMFSFWSLRLVDRKDVYLSRDSGVQKIGNVSREDAIEIKNATR